MKTILKVKRLALFAGFTVFQFLRTQCFAQIEFCRFDFNTSNLKLATVGYNGISCDPEAESTGSAYIMNMNCGAAKGLDLEVPNSSNFLDVEEFGMTFRFQRDETLADFFVRGGTHFYVSGSVLFIQYRTSNGAGGYTDYGPFNTGYTLIDDDSYRSYTFDYVKATGMGRVLVDGSVVWSNNGPNSRALYWTGAGSAIIGSVMDGNCMGHGVLDYATLFTPSPLGALFGNVESFREGTDVGLEWEIQNPGSNGRFKVERSFDGKEFTAITEIGTHGNDLQYGFADEKPGAGELFYRIKYVDENAVETVSIVTVVPPESFDFSFWPNPAQGLLSVLTGSRTGRVNLSIFDLNGAKKLQMQADAAEPIEMDISGFAEGVYLLVVSGESGSRSKKLRIQ